MKSEEFFQKPKNDYFCNNVAKSYGSYAGTNIEEARFASHESPS